MKSSRLVPCASIALTIAILLLAACSGTASGPDQTSRTGVSSVSTIARIPLNSQGHTAEQQNIIDRQQVTNDPTKVMWIQLITLEGKIVARMSVAHKITSSGKRLEPIAATGCIYINNGLELPKFGKYCTNELVQADGTFGSSTQYEFWFDTYHRYNQLSTGAGLGYLLTDYPIDLSNPMDRVTGLYNADKAAVAWEALQEQRMCAQEHGTYANPDENGAGGKCVRPMQPEPATSPSVPNKATQKGANS